MKVIFHEDFYRVYTSDPAGAAGRMEAVVKSLESRVEFVNARPASEADILAVHTADHVQAVKSGGLFAIAALAAGGSIQAAEIGLTEPSFALVRPPGHHASSGSAWGFCFFNNMAVAVEKLRREKKIRTAYVLDIDLHFGDGTVNILGACNGVQVHNLETHHRDAYLKEIADEMNRCRSDMIGISAGFDNHEEDWGGLLKTEDYHEIGQMVRAAARRSGGGCFGVLEGGYNHDVLGSNALALIEGLNTG